MARFIELWNHEVDNNKTRIVIHDRDNYSHTREHEPNQSQLYRIYWLMKKNKTSLIGYELQPEGIGLKIKLEL